MFKDDLLDFINTEKLFLQLIFSNAQCYYLDY